MTKSEQFSEKTNGGKEMFGLLLSKGQKTQTKSEQFSEKNGGNEVFGLLLIQTSQPKTLTKSEQFLEKMKGKRCLICSLFRTQNFDSQSNYLK